MSLRSGSGNPCFVIRLSSLRLSSASKAPCTSIVIIVTSRLAESAISTSWVNEATRSIADLLGCAPPWCGLRIPFVSAVQAIRRAITRSSPFETQEIMAIGRRDRTEGLSFLPTFGSITTSASFQLRGKWLSARHKLYTACIQRSTCFQQAWSSLTVIPSVPGEVLETPIVFRSTSSIETSVFHSRCPVPTQSYSGSCCRSSAEKR